VVCGMWYSQELAVEGHLKCELREHVFSLPEKGSLADLAYNGKKYKEDKEFQDISRYVTTGKLTGRQQK